MLFIAYFRWWYGTGWLTAFNQLRQKLKRLYLVFSVPMLLRTLFKPWRQIIAPKDSSAQIGQKLRGVTDNLVSRFIGFWVRVLTILVAAAATVITGLVGGLILLSWPFAPVLVVWLVLRSVGII